MREYIIIIIEIKSTVDDELCMKYELCDSYNL